MTNIEAIDWLKKFIGCHNEDSRDCAYRECCDCVYNYNGQIADKVVDVAIKALEKQIPKKQSAYFNDNNNHFRVTSDGFLLCSRDPIKYPFMNYKYCPSCGQALEWE